MGSWSRLALRSDKITALKEAFYRQTAPNITSLFATATGPKETVESYCSVWSWP